MASLLMNGDHISSHLHQHLPLHLLRQEYLDTFAQDRDESNTPLVSVLAMPDCHAGVECSSSALIDLQDHDPALRVKRLLSQVNNLVSGTHTQRASWIRSAPQPFLPPATSQAQASNETHLLSGGFHKAATSVRSGPPIFVAIAARGRRR